MQGEAQCRRREAAHQLGEQPGEVMRYRQWASSLAEPAGEICHRGMREGEPLPGRAVA